MYGHFKDSIVTKSQKKPQRQREGADTLRTKE